ncbi:energy-coupling factor ABC transporter permease [Shewanella sp. Isolate11]|uniref:energy-coupling factor ABC transporter permease n=1 Tax=Shewanella sp. Isolate11 TaxID=2908530 RepID=UPI001EFE96AE|nr:energy-coupling factor ABC transporter permease [Shewanella sp. Isolate11]MCG9697691.1 energy-coupling factor ABC transporter permease [Shewanella sp. Isolate11]
MTQFILQRLNNIDWSLDFGQLLALGVLVLWLRAIWPSQDLRALAKDKKLQSRAWLAAFAINALWLMNASITSGMHLHFLGLVTLMLMFGWRLATLITLLPVMFFSTFVVQQPFEFAIYMLLMTAMPLFLCFLVYSQVFKYLPHHLFIYIFCSAFINGFTSILFYMLPWAVWLWLSSDYDWLYITDSYLLLIPLLGFPEALLNGMAVTLLVVYRPEYLYDYSDKTYFDTSKE